MMIIKRETAVVDVYRQFIAYPQEKEVWNERNLIKWFKEWVISGKVTASIPAGAYLSVEAPWGINIRNLQANQMAYIEYSLPEDAKQVTIMWTFENAQTNVNRWVRLMFDNANYLELLSYNDGSNDVIQFAKIEGNVRTQVKGTTFARGVGYYMPFELWVQLRDDVLQWDYFHLDGYENYYPNAPSVWQLARKHILFGGINTSIASIRKVQIGVENKGTTTIYTDFIQVSPITLHPFYLGYTPSNYKYPSV